MFFTDQLPSWEGLVHQAGPGRDPFQYLFMSVERLAYPHVPSSIFEILLGFGGVYLAVIIVCFCLLLIPIVKGPESRNRHFWLYKKQHLPSSNTPFYIFNSGLVMVISQLVASMVFEAYIFLNFHAIKSPEFARKAYIYVWLELCWLPGYFGFHVTAFSSLYTCLCSPRRATTQLHFLLRPKFLNTLFFSIPILVMLQTIGWCLALFLNTRNQTDAYLGFVSATSTGSEAWKNDIGSMITSSSTMALSNLSIYLQTCDKFITIARWSSACWAMIGLVLALFYAMTVASLVRLLKNCIVVASGKQSCFTRTLEYRIEAGVTTLELETTLESMKLPVQPSAKRMKDGYTYLVVHCSVMLLCLILDVVIGIVMTVKTKQAAVNPKWRQLGNWITLVGSCFVSVAMLIQSWRILTERDQTQGKSTSIDRHVLEEQEVTPARFIVETDDGCGDDEEFRTARKIMPIMDHQSTKHSSFPPCEGNLSLTIEQEGIHPSHQPINRVSSGGAAQG